MYDDEMSLSEQLRRFAITAYSGYVIGDSAYELVMNAAETIEKPEACCNEEEFVTALKNTYDTKKLSQTERCCLNCRYAHEESWGLVCFGQKDAPKVYSDDVCEGWKPIVDAEGWCDIDKIGPPNVGEEVIICCKDGMMFIAKWHNNEKDGDYWIVRGPHDIRHYIKTDWVTHWKPKPKKPMN